MSLEEYPCEVCFVSTDKVCVCVCVCACVRVRACVRACARARVGVFVSPGFLLCQCAEIGLLEVGFLDGHLSATGSTFQGFFFSQLDEGGS